MGKAGGVWMEVLHGTMSWEPLVMVFFTVQGPKAQFFYILCTQLYKPIYQHILGLLNRCISSIYICTLPKNPNKI
jgi:hypothetical protein